MANEYPYTAEDLAALNATLLGGIQTKTFNNRSTSAHPLSELLKLRAEIIRSLTAETTGRTYRVAVVDKGV